jgi:hypothetical protein
MAQTILYISTYIGYIIKTKNPIFGFFCLLLNIVNIQS